MVKLTNLTFKLSFTKDFRITIRLPSEQSNENEYIIWLNFNKKEMEKLANLTFELSYTNDFGITIRTIKSYWIYYLIKS